MGSDDGVGIWVGAALLLFFVILIFSNMGSTSEGYKNGVRDARAEAVEHGYGEWVPDKNGKTTFKWKE